MWDHGRAHANPNYLLRGSGCPEIVEMERCQAMDGVELLSAVALVLGFEEYRPRKFAAEPN